MADGSRATHGSTAEKKGEEKVESTVAHRDIEAPPTKESWQRSIIKVEQIQELMNKGFLHEKVISQWKVPSGDVGFPSEDTGEVTVFRRYFKVGFGLPTSEFFPWGAELLWGSGATSYSEFISAHGDLRPPVRDILGDRSPF